MISILKKCITIIILFIITAQMYSPLYAETDDRYYEQKSRFSQKKEIEGSCINILQSNEIQHNSCISKGIEWNWSDDGTLYVTGTAADKSFTNMYSDSNNLPNGMYPGDTLYTRLTIGGYGICMEFLFYRQSGISESVLISGSGTVKVPDDAVGLSMRPIVSKGQTADAYMEQFELFRPVQKDRKFPLVVSFIDDDTTKEVFVQRYHDACIKNGILGNYAVITSHLDEGDTNLETLLAYQEEGFGMLAHCDYQNGNNSPYWRGDGGYRTQEELEECWQNLSTCIYRMETYGLNDLLMWVTPFGIHDPDIQNMARELGMKCLFSIGKDGINTVYDEDRWNIKRFSLTADDSVAGKSLKDAKKQVDECVSLGTGWLIITTHFNSWGKLSWDHTPDENGYEMGYERFNEIVQYALSAGMIPMTIPEAFQYYGPLLDENYSAYENAIVITDTIHYYEKTVRIPIRKLPETVVWSSCYRKFSFNTARVQ